MSGIQIGPNCKVADTQHYGRLQLRTTMHRFFGHCFLPEYQVSFEEKDKASSLEDNGVM